MSRGEGAAPSDEVAIADEGCGDGDEGEEVFRRAFVATVQASTAGRPGNGPLDHPTVTAEPL